MARGNLSACLAITLKHEGGYVDHPADPGGATNHGITHKVLAAFRGKPVTKQDVRNLTVAEAERIYDKNYWRVVNGELLPYGVDLATFDAGVNSGPARGAKWLQRAVGATQDGKVGPDTLRLTANLPGDQTIRRICAYRLSFVQGLGTWKVFGKGWSRRIADIEAQGVTMWLRNSQGWSADKTADELARQAGKAADQSRGNSNGAAGAGGSGALVGAGDIATGTGWLWVLAGVAVVACVLLLVRAAQNRARAEAYAEAVDGQVADAMAGQ